MVQWHPDVALSPGTGSAYKIKQTINSSIQSFTQAWTLQQMKNLEANKAKQLGWLFGQIIMAVQYKTL